jgi:hypothetical protein
VFPTTPPYPSNNHDPALLAIRDRGSSCGNLLGTMQD